MSFYSGQKVVCINDNQDEFCPDSSVRGFSPWCDDCPKKGKVYTVIGYDVHPHPFFASVPCINLWELKRGPFAEARFVPLNEKQTDISALELILNQQPMETV